MPKRNQTSRLERLEQKQAELDAANDPWCGVVTYNPIDDPEGELAIAEADTKGRPFMLLPEIPDDPDGRKWEAIAVEHQRRLVEDASRMLPAGEMPKPEPEPTPRSSPLHDNSVRPLPDLSKPNQSKGE